MKLEIRGKQLLIDGYVNTVLRTSRIISSEKGPFKEIIGPKVFERALSRTNDVELLFNHNKDRKLGSIKDGNLELFEDSIGLRAKCAISDPEVQNLANRGALRGWSFGFICNSADWSDGKDGIKRRYVKDLDLTEVSILSVQPAYEATSINVVGEKRGLVEQRFGGFISSDGVLERYFLEKQIELLKLRGGIR